MFCNEFFFLWIHLVLNKTKQNGGCLLMYFDDNTFLSVLLGSSASMEETYENLKCIFRKNQYAAYGRNICGYLNVTAVILYLQLNYTKVMLSFV